MNSLLSLVNNLSADAWDTLLQQQNLKTVAYWGYNPENSGAPSKSASNGRINPSGISYLYTARDEKTAISEIQPMNGALISVAKIKTKKTLNENPVGNRGKAVYTVRD
jgi:hypothetical protein